VRGRKDLNESTHCRGWDSGQVWLKLLSKLTVATPVQPICNHPAE